MGASRWGGGWKLTGGEERVLAEINITPLTDVMLVLLVIFMVTTPLFVMESFKLKLPRAGSATSEPGKGTVLLITIDGAYYLNGERVDRGALSDKLAREFKKTDSPGILIKADKGSLHGLVVEALDMAKRAGAEKLSIATEPEGAGAR